MYLAAITILDAFFVLTLESMNPIGRPPDIIHEKAKANPKKTGLLWI
jgi:hypothetical protein